MQVPCASCTAGRVNIWWGLWVTVKIPRLHPQRFGRKGFRKFGTRTPARPPWRNISVNASLKEGEQMHLLPRAACSNTLLQTARLQTTEICFLPVLETRSLNSRCQQHRALSVDSRGGSFPFLASGGCPEIFGVPWLVGT